MVLVLESRLVAGVSVGVKVSSWGAGGVKIVSRVKFSRCHGQWLRLAVVKFSILCDLLDIQAMTISCFCTGFLDLQTVPSVSSMVSLRYKNFSTRLPGDTKYDNNSLSLSSVSVCVCVCVSLFSPSLILFLSIQGHQIPFLSCFL